MNKNKIFTLIHPPPQHELYVNLCRQIKGTYHPHHKHNITCTIGSVLFEEHCTINNRLLNSQEFSGLGESEKAKKEPSRHIHICRSRKSRILLVDTLGFLRHPPLQKKINRPMLDLHILPLQSLSATLTRHSYCSLKNLQAHTMLKRHTCDWYL